MRINRILPVLGVLSLGALGVVDLGCTEANLQYQDLAGVADLGSDVSNLDLDLSGEDLVSPVDVQGLEGSPDLAPDTQPPPDTQPWPDVLPWQCVTDKDCDDKLSCTTDKCTAQKKCSNTINAGHCVISKICYKGGEKNPASECQTCSPSNSTIAWTDKIDGAPCKNDNIWCTKDVCKKGICTHDVQPTACLISNTCHVKDKLNPTNDCEACTPSKSQSAWTVLSDNSPCASDSLWCT